MGINLKHFRELIVRPACEEIGMWTEAAEELLMLTGAVETDLGEFLKQGFKAVNDARGVGRGVFSMEPETFIWLRSIPAYKTLLYGIPDDLIVDLKLAAKAARIRYRVVPTKLPRCDDVVGLASYWKLWYNASQKGLSIEQAIKKYKKLVLGEY